MVNSVKTLGGYERHLLNSLDAYFCVSLALYIYALVTDIVHYFVMNCSCKLKCHLSTLYLMWISSFYDCCKVVVQTRWKQLLYWFHSVRCFAVLEFLELYFRDLGKSWLLIIDFVSLARPGLVFRIPEEIYIYYICIDVNCLRNFDSRFMFSFAAFGHVSYSRVEEDVYGGLSGSVWNASVS